MELSRLGDFDGVNLPLLFYLFYLGGLFFLRGLREAHSLIDCEPFFLLELRLTTS